MTRIYIRGVILTVTRTHIRGVIRAMTRTHMCGVIHTMTRTHVFSKLFFVNKSWSESTYCSRFLWSCLIFHPRNCPAFPTSPRLYHISPHHSIRPSSPHIIPSVPHLPTSSRLPHISPHHPVCPKSPHIIPSVPHLPSRSERVLFYFNP